MIKFQQMSKDQKMTLLKSHIEIIKVVINEDLTSDKKIGQIKQVLFESGVKALLEDRRLGLEAEDLAELILQENSNDVNDLDETDRDEIIDEVADVIEKKHLQ